MGTTLVPKEDLLDDLKGINEEMAKWNRNPWLPTKYIKTLVESHLELYKMVETLVNDHAS